MKKISFKNLNLKEVEQLSREQLKNVLGGYAGGSEGSGDDPCNGSNPDASLICCNNREVSGNCWDLLGMGCGIITNDESRC